ncbi:MAG: hypothetical protein PUK21_06315 [Peptostreptococcaceae bacterium]|nr:hypothetical protein [Peptostreptococcaceae bacterium]MDY5739254.1 hypothetical protein [Anaerovoracaceae bacterium]
MELKIRGVKTETVARIDDLRGKRSRNEYLLDKLDEIAFSPAISDAEDRYIKILDRTTKVISENTKVLEMIFLDK